MNTLTKITVKRGDYGYVISWTIKHLVNGAWEPLDCSGAEEIWIFLKVGSDEALRLGPCDPDYDDGDNTADWANGEGHYLVQQGDLDITADYKAEIELTLAAGGRITVPNDSYVEVSVIQDLDDAS